MSDQDTQEEVEIEEPIGAKRIYRDGGKAWSKRDRKPRLSADSKRLKVIEMTVKGISPAEIGRAIAMPESTVKDIIKRFQPVFNELENASDYRKVKSDILAAGQLAALKSAFSGNKLAKAGFLSTLQGFEILNKAERLESGQSTENHAHSFLGKLSIADE